MSDRPISDFPLEILAVFRDPATGFGGLGFRIKDTFFATLAKKGDPEGAWFTRNPTPAIPEALRGWYDSFAENAPPEGAWIVQELRQMADPHYEHIASGFLPTPGGDEELVRRTALLREADCPYRAIPQAVENAFHAYFAEPESCFDPDDFLLFLSKHDLFLRALAPPPGRPKNPVAPRTPRDASAN